MNIFQIDAQILSCIDTETGEVLDEAMVDALQMERTTKIENVGLWAKEVMAEIEAIKNEVRNLNKRIKSDENLLNSLKRYITYATDEKPFKTAKVAMSYRSSESVEITDINAIPKEYLRYKDPEPDKTAIKKAIKAEGIVDGARLVTKKNLQLR